MNMRNYTMEVSKKEEVNGVTQYVKQGEIKVFYPTLSAFFPEVKEVKDDEEGFPLYSAEGDSPLDWLFGAALAAVKAQARNKLLPGTATLKPGQTIAETLEALIQAGVRGGGEALAIRREMLQAFASYVSTLGKASNVQAAINQYASSAQALQIQPQKVKDSMTKYLTGFAESLTAEQAARFEAPLSKLVEACAGDEVDIS